MTLTTKQEKFAQCLADGLSQSDAYRSAFSASRMKPETIYKRASELVRDGKVAGRVAELRKALSQEDLWTREKSVKALANIADGGEAKANEIVAAIKELNSMHGFNAPTKVEVAGNITLNVNFD